MLIDTCQDNAISKAGKALSEVNRHDFTNCIFSWQTEVDSLIRAIVPSINAGTKRNVLICASDPFELIEAVKLENETCREQVTYCGFMTDSIVCVAFRESGLVKLIDLSL